MRVADGFSEWSCRFGGAGYRDARWEGLDTGWRELPLILLEIPRAGTWMVETAVGAWQVKPGEVLIMAAGARARMVASPATKGTMQSSWILLSWERGGWPFQLQGEVLVLAAPPVARLVEELARAASAKDDAAQARRVAQAFNLLAELSRHFQPVVPSDERLVRVMRWVGENLGKAMRRRDLARVGGVSEAHLQDLFRSGVGISPMEFVLQARLRRALELLPSLHLPIAEVALRCGFSSAYHFSRLFKQRVGCSPRAYRQQVSR